MGKERGVFEAGAILRKGTAGAKALRERMWDVPCVPKAAGRGAGGGGWARLHGACVALLLSSWRIL